MNSDDVRLTLDYEEDLQLANKFKTHLDLTNLVNQSGSISGTELSKS